MRTGHYRFILYLQYFLLFVDLFMNSFAELFRTQNVVLLVLYVIQDLCILFNLIIVFLLFFNTYIFQAGLIGILVSKFKVTIIVVFVYFGLSVGFHAWGLARKWPDPNKYIWNDGFRAFYAIQRAAAIFYYYFYKRTALRLGDPRFYQDSEWIHREFDKRR